jgi:protein SCO1/2
MRWLWLSGILGMAIILASTMMWFGHEHFTETAGREMAALRPASGGKAQIGGDFTLTDQNGNPVTAQDLKGRFALISFGFASCPDVCPTALGTITEALNRIGSAADAIQPVFITVDPERDSAAALKNYMTAFHPRFLALTGTPEQIKTVTQAYKVYYHVRKETPGDKNYLVDHSSFLYLMGPDGEYVTHFPYSIPASELAVRLKEISQSEDGY